LIVAAPGAVLSIDCSGALDETRTTGRRGCLSVFRDWRRSFGVRRRSTPTAGNAGFKGQAKIAAIETFLSVVWTAQTPFLAFAECRMNYGSTGSDLIFSVIWPVNALSISTDLEYCESFDVNHEQR